MEFFTRPHTNPYLRVVGMVVRARAELTFIAVTLTAFFILRAHIGPLQTSITVAVIVVVVFTVPASRRFVVRRWWCVTTRHRIRACFSQTRTMTHHGRMPFLWWSRPSPVGERVRVWLPAGMSVKDLERVTDELATACWAREARIVASRAQAALVVVDIVRRDPLTSSSVLTPSVLDGVDLHLVDEDDTVVIPLPDRADLAPQAAATQPVPTQRTGTHGTSAAVPRASRTAPVNTVKPAAKPVPVDDPEPEVTGFGGVDVSDYV